MLQENTLRKHLLSQKQTAWYQYSLHGVLSAKSKAALNYRNRERVKKNKTEGAGEMRQKVKLDFKMTACADLFILNYFSHFKHHCEYFSLFFLCTF